MLRIGALFKNGTVSYTKYLVDNFPKLISFVDGGSGVKTGKSLVNTPNGNIVRTAYRDWLWNDKKKTLSDQRSSWDLVAVYYMIEKPMKYFEVSTSGFLDFDIEKGCRWVKSDSLSNQCFISQKKEFDNEISDYLNTIIVKPKEYRQFGFFD